MMRHVDSNQRMPRLMAFRVNGTGTAAINEGSLSQATLIDNGTGDYTLTFTTPFARVPVVVVTPISSTGDVIATVHASFPTASAVRILCWDGTDGTTAKDAIFHCLVYGFDVVEEY